MNGTRGCVLELGGAGGAVLGEPLRRERGAPAAAASVGAAKQQRVFEEATAAHMQALAAALQETDEVAENAPCPPQHEPVQQQPPQALPAPPSPAPSPELLPECPVCLECYQRPPSVHAPVSLPCGHSVCRQCVLDLQTTAPS